MKKNAVVVGAGINGLVASNYLQKNNFDVTLIEKNNYIGGACIKDNIEYNKEKIFYPKGATVLGMMKRIQKSSWESFTNIFIIKHYHYINHFNYWFLRICK